MSTRRRRVTTVKKTKPVTRKDVRAIINQRVDTDSDVNITTITVVPFDVALMSQLTSTATGSNQKFILESLDVRIVATNPASVGSVFVRFIVFMWHPDSQTDLPVFSDILADAETVDSILSPIVDDTQRAKCFTVMRSFIIKLGEATSVEGNERKHLFMRFVKPNFPRKFMFNTAAGVGRNQIFMFVTSDIANASSPPNIIMKTELRTKTHNI